MKKRSRTVLCVSLSLFGMAGIGYAAEVSIYDIQSTTSDGDASVYDGGIHDVLGGVVTHIWSGFNDRVYLQDPGHPEWGAIVVKDGEGGELANAVNVGDWVSFQDIHVDEFRGTTFLQYRRSYAPDVQFTKVSAGNAVPPPTLLTAADLIYPSDTTATEQYESMVVTLQDVTVGQMDLGRKDDNYELLQDADIAWATDYMNVDAGAPYDPRIAPGVALQSITGVVEQNSIDDWDYYQLNTRSAADIVPEPGTLGLLALGLASLVRRKRR